jgi:hypothetical protein
VLLHNNLPRLESETSRDDSTRDKTSLSNTSVVTPLPFCYSHDSKRQTIMSNTIRRSFKSASHVQNVPVFNMSKLSIRPSYLKGQCHEIFDFWFFSSISFPQAPEYTIRAVSKFFENSRRYSQLKVCHRCRWWQMQKIFNHQSFNYLVWTPFGGRVNL